MQSRLQEYERLLRHDARRLTQPRKLLAERVLSIHTHFTAEDLIEWARKHHRSISPATVYRTLELLVRAQLLAEHDFGRGRKMYEHIVGHEHHDHLCCIRCGKIQEFSSDGIEHLQEVVLKKERFQSTSHSLKIFGLCGRCQKGWKRKK